MNVKARLKELESKLNTSIPKSSVLFILENGETYTPKEDPLSYLLLFGNSSPRGKISRVKLPCTDSMDGLSKAIYETMPDLLNDNGKLLRELTKSKNNN